MAKTMTEQEKNLREQVNNEREYAYLRACMSIRIALYDPRYYLSKCDGEEDWCERAIRLLSMGRASCKAPVHPDKKTFEQLQDSFHDDMKIIEKNLKLIDDLSMLWYTVLEGEVLVGWEVLADIGRLNAMLESLGLDILLDTYFSGVPIEDILA